MARADPIKRVARPSASRQITWSPVCGGRRPPGGAADSLFPGLWGTPALTAQGSRKFTETWKAKFNATPDWFQALGYDTARVLFAGITKAGSIDGTRVRDAL